MIPHVIVLEPDLIIHKIYSGYWFFGRPTIVRFPGGDFASSVDLIPYTLPDGTSGANVLVKADKYRYLLAADVPESELALMIATQRPIDLAALNEPLT